MIRLIVLFLLAMAIMSGMKTVAVTASCDTPFWEGFKLGFGEICPRLLELQKQRDAGVQP